MEKEKPIQKDLFAGLLKELPPILFRNHPKFKELTGMSPRSVANMDCCGSGPQKRVLIGRVIGYPRDAFVEWLSSRVKEPESKPKI